MTIEIEVRPGVPAAQKEAAVRLYCLAFEQKLRPFLGSPERTTRFLVPGLMEDRIICAIAGGRVVGVAGFKRAGRGMFEPGLAAFFREYGITAPFRLAALLLMERMERPGELLMDGIAVAPEMRGQGIGGLLLDAIEDHARRHGEKSIRLDVIDTNPGAKKLYERNGFKGVRSRGTGLLSPFFAFTSTLQMRKLLD
ncbi:MAG: GNAT family N-acetyltransferase [Pseudomonadota bacterium]